MSSNQTSKKKVVEKMYDACGHWVGMFTVEYMTRAECEKRYKELIIPSSKPTKSKRVKKQ